MNRMTNEESIKWLKQIKAVGYEERLLNHTEAIDMAIKALEQQPCTDAISRDDALKAIAKAKTVMSENNELFVAMINAQMNIHLLPSVSVAEKTGRWIESNGVGMFVCSVCNDSFYPMPTCMGEPILKYCPNCGARMGEPQESEVTK